MCFTRKSLRCDGCVGQFIIINTCAMVYESNCGKLSFGSLVKWNSHQLCNSLLVRTFVARGIECDNAVHLVERKGAYKVQYQISVHERRM